MQNKKRKTLKDCMVSIADYEDALIEILMRVPARPLVRFKCVSKRWLCLISDPGFCHQHTLRNPRPSVSAFFTPCSPRFHVIPLRLHPCGSIVVDTPCNPLNFVESDIETVQSCNGLLLCRLKDPDYRHPTIASSLIYYVLNPTTNQFQLLIPPAAAAATEAECRIFGYALAFDPSISPYYKVFILWFVDNPSTKGLRYYHIEMYSSETRSWKLLESSFLVKYRVNYRRGAYCNGAVHWVGYNCELSYYHIDEERVGFVNGLPGNINKYHGTVISRYFRESPDGTHLLLIDHRRKCLTNLQIMEMAKDYSGWSVKYNVDLVPLRAAYPQFVANHLIVLSFAAKKNENENDKDEECSSLLLHFPGKVINYNVRDKTFKSTSVIRKAGFDHFFVVIKTNFHYVESLAVV